MDSSGLTTLKNLKVTERYSYEKFHDIWSTLWSFFPEDVDGVNYLADIEEANNLVEFVEARKNVKFVGDPEGIVEFMKLFFDNINDDTLKFTNDPDIIEMTCQRGELDKDLQHSGQLIFLFNRSKIYEALHRLTKRGGLSDTDTEESPERFGNLNTLAMFANRSLFCPSFPDIFEEDLFMNRETKLYDALENIWYPVYLSTERNERHGFNHPNAPEWLMFYDNLPGGKFCDQFIWKRNPHFALK